MLVVPFVSMGHALCVPDKSGNMGEQNEVFIKAFLTKNFQQLLELDGAPHDITQIREMNFGPGIPMPKWNESFEKMLKSMDYQSLKPFFSKAKNTFKADIFINDVAYSLKYENAANPAIVNHTSRAGFLRVCNRMGENILTLDHIIDHYWNLRIAGKIKEDTKNTDANSPFKDYKNELEWILRYFIFEGTASKDSDFPANKVLSFDDPFDPTTYKILNKREVIDSIWHKLVFSMRPKGMPAKYDPVKHCELAPWVRSLPPDYKPRGCLHVRVATH